MRTATFNTIGADVSDCTSVSELLHKSNLDYKVIKVPIYFQDGFTYKTYPGKVFTQKEGTSEICGVVSPKYKVCQNIDAFSFLDYIKSDVNLSYVRAGETDNGLVYVIAKLDPLTVLGDLITPYIIFQNSHNGLSSMRATISPLRIVCQNQFNLAFSTAPNTSRIVHSSNMNKRLIAAQQMISNSTAYMSAFTTMAETLATKKVPHSLVVDVFDDLLANRTSYESSLNEFLSCYTCDDNSNFIGTAWGIVNGAADYLTHCKNNKLVTDDTKFVSTTLQSDILNRVVDRCSAV